MSTPTRTFRRRIGEILVSDGVVTQDQIDEALLIQKRTKEPLGAILQDMGAATESDIAKTICVQYQLPFLCLANYEIDEKVAQILPKEFLHRYKLLPFDRVGNVVLTGVAEVPEEGVLAEIAKQFQNGVALYVCYCSEILRELNRICPMAKQPQKAPVKTSSVSKVDADEGDGEVDSDETESDALVFGNGKGSFLEELDSTWDSIFETAKDSNTEKSPG